LLQLPSANQGEMTKLRAQYEEQIAVTEKERRISKQDELARQEKLETLQAMFDSEESNVFVSDKMF